jgi:hypothetical protein
VVALFPQVLLLPGARPFALPQLRGAPSFPDFGKGGNHDSLNNLLLGDAGARPFALPPLRVPHPSPILGKGGNHDSLNNLPLCGAAVSPLRSQAPTLIGFSR